MSSFITTQFRCSLVLLLSALLVSACSSSSDTNSANTNSGSNGIDNISLSDSTSIDTDESTVSLNDSTSVDLDEPTGDLSDSTSVDLDETTGELSDSTSSDLDETTDALSDTTSTDTAPVVDASLDLLAPLATRVDFDITVPVYVSDSLQVQLSWGDRELSAGWVVDETWRVSDEFPSDTENLLTVTFVDDNGAVVLGSYEASFRTDTSPTQPVEIFADQFESDRWDDDADGVNNLDESIAGTDPLSAPIPPTLNLVRVDFGINVPAIMSDALQVHLDWGDEKIVASWVGDESWSAFADLPADTEEPLIVTLFDEDGDLPLGSYLTTYQTGSSDSEYFQIESRQINTHRFDTDVDGVSNFREVSAETDPLVSDSSVSLTFDTIGDRISMGRCADCHSSWRNREGLYESLLSEPFGDRKKLVVPFKPEESYLVDKLEGSMLRFGGTGLAEQVRAWIALGALDN